MNTDTRENTETQSLVGKLASTLAVKQSMLLAIVRTSDSEVLVTIQPTPGGENLKGTTLPLQVKGAPDAIDAELLAALEHYLPARHFVITTAQEVAEATKTAAEAAKVESAKKAAKTTPAKKPPTASNAGAKTGAQGGTNDPEDEEDEAEVVATAPPAKPKYPGRLLITVEPSDATITAFSKHANETITFTSGVEGSLPINQIAAVTIAKDGYETITRNLMIGTTLRSETFTLEKSLNLFTNGGDEGSGDAQ